MPLILTGVGIYSTTYLDDKGNERLVSVKYGQDIETLNLPAEVLDGLKKLNRVAGRKTIHYFTQVGEPAVAKKDAVSIGDLVAEEPKPEPVAEQPEVKVVEVEPKEEEPTHNDEQTGLPLSEGAVEVVADLPAELPVAEEPKAEIKKTSSKKKQGNKKAQPKKVEKLEEAPVE